MVYETERTARFGKELSRRPACPFCGLDIDRPTYPQTRRYGEMPVGTCTCGAVYAYDITGHNLGSAFAEALVFGCNMDWDLAWSLQADEDYLEKRVEKYDSQSHLIIPTGHFEGRRVSGVLYFIRLNREILEVTRQGVEKNLAKSRAKADPSLSGPAGEKKLSKNEIEEMVRDYRLDWLPNVRLDNKTIRLLQRLLYSGDYLIRARAAEMLGQAATAVARRDPGPVSGLLKELLNSVAAPGASSWGSLDAIGEIIAGSPDLFAGYLPLLYNFLSDQDYRPRVLRAIGLVAGARPDLVRKATFRLLAYLRDPDPAARGHAARLFGLLKAPEARPDLEAISEDGAEIEIYSKGEIEKTSVGRLAREALENI